MSENCVIELEKGNYKKCLCFKDGCGLTLARTCRDPGATSAQWAVVGTIDNLKPKTQHLLWVTCIIEVPVNFYA